MSFVNKLFMVLLLSLVILKASDIFSEFLISPELKLPRTVYPVAELEIDFKEQKPAALEELESIDNLISTADIQSGMKLARKCLSCHSFEDQGKNKNGPNLYNIVDKLIASKEGYPYSRSILKLKIASEKWNIANLNAFLYKPNKFLKGTKMSFVGLKKAQDRADIIAYLQSISQ